MNSVKPPGQSTFTGIRPLYSSNLYLTHETDRCLNTALTTRPKVPPLCHSRIYLHPCLTHRRNLFDRFFNRQKTQPKFLDPLSPDFLKRRPATEQMPSKGDLAPSSILDDAIPKPSSSPSASQTDSSVPPESPGPRMRDPSVMAAVLDPTPSIRKRWQRKMVIRAIKGRHRLSKTTLIARTERESLSKSPMIKTSVKKLGPLARQIAGKPIEEAIIQMRFSKKRAALDVRKHLEYARDEAIVRRGMGLGRTKAENGDGQPEEPKMIAIIDKDGKTRRITDRTSIYIDQAWVGRGEYGKEPSFRARGRIDLLRPPTTSEFLFSASRGKNNQTQPRTDFHPGISVVLKEEATRIRLAEERQRKRERKKVWVQLPNRPVTTQRQYCLW